MLEMSPVISVDSTALHMLEDLKTDLKHRGVHICFASVGNRVESTMRTAGLLDKIGVTWFHPTVHAAVQFCVWHRQNARHGASGDTPALSTAGEATPPTETGEGGTGPHEEAHEEEEEELRPEPELALRSAEADRARHGLELQGVPPRREPAGNGELNPDVRAAGVGVGAASATLERIRLSPHLRSRSSSDSVSALDVALVELDDDEAGGPLTPLLASEPAAGAGIFAPLALPAAAPAAPPAI